MSTFLNELLIVAIFAVEKETNRRMNILSWQIDAVCRAHGVQSTKAGVESLPPKAKEFATELTTLYAQWRETGEQIQKLLNESMVR